MVLSKITPRGGTEGVLSKSTYDGFEFNFLQGVGFIVPAGPRAITQKVFTDAVPE